MTPDEVREALQDRRLMVVAKETGLHYNTLLHISKGTSLEPKWATIDKLSEYLSGGPLRKENEEA